MNIHEHQAKNLLRTFGAPTPKGVVIYNISELPEKVKTVMTLSSLVIFRILDLSALTKYIQPSGPKAGPSGPSIPEANGLKPLGL